MNDNSNHLARSSHDLRGGIREVLEAVNIYAKIGTKSCQLSTDASVEIERIVAVQGLKTPTNEFILKEISITKLNDRNADPQSRYELKAYKTIVY